METSLLQEQLQAYGIPYELWWTVFKSKTLADLSAERSSGECDILVTRENGLLRIVNAVSIDIMYKDPATGSVLRLKEERREFNDGTMTSREKDTTIGAKIKLSEIPMVAARRVLDEQLGMKFENSFGTYTGEVEKKRMTSVYPGLQTLYRISTFDLLIGEDQYKPEGYITNQNEITSYFKWEELPPSQNE